MYWAAKAQRVKCEPPVEVRVIHLRRTNRLVDLMAPAYAVKGGIDGLVDAGVIPDDDPTIVVGLKFVTAEKVGYDGLALEVTEV